MQSEPPSIQINFADEFQRNIRGLSKKYRHIRSDVQPIIERLQVGELLGDQIPETDYVVYKVRVKNSDIQKGKSSGYRLIYYVQTPTLIFLMTIYSKSDRVDISANKIRRLLSAFNEVREDEGETEDNELSPGGETQDESEGDRPGD